MGVVAFESDAAFDRVARATERVESWAGSYSPAAGRRAPGSDPIFVKVTGSASGGLYPAVLTVWDSTGAAWSDLADACKSRAANGEALTNGSRYAGRVAGVSGTDTLVIVSAPAVPPPPPPPPAGLDGAYALVGQVDGSTGTPRDHTVTAQDLTGGSPGDTGAAFSGVYLSDGSQAPNNCYLALFLSSSGDYFGVPAQPASGTQPGWVTTAAQTFAGDKTFTDDVTVDQYSTLTGGATVAGSAGGAGIGSYPDSSWSLRVGKTLVVGGASGTAIRLAAGSWSTTDYSEINASGYQLYKSSAPQIELETVNLGGGQQGRARVAYNGTNFPGGNQNPAGGGSTPQFVGGIYVAGTVLGSITSGDVTGALGYTPLDPANDLSDVASPATAAGNLGLGGGLTGTYTVGGGASGDLASITLTNGVVTGVTTVP